MSYLRAYLNDTSIGFYSEGCGCCSDMESISDRELVILNLKEMVNDKLKEAFYYMKLIYHLENSDTVKEAIEIFEDEDKDSKLDYSITVTEREKEDE